MRGPDCTSPETPPGRGRTTDTDTTGERPRTLQWEGPLGGPYGGGVSDWERKGDRSRNDGVGRWHGDCRNHGTRVVTPICRTPKDLKHLPSGPKRWLTETLVPVHDQGRYTESNGRSVPSADLPEVPPTVLRVGPVLTLTFEGAVEIVSRLTLVSHRLDPSDLPGVLRGTRDPLSSGRRKGRTNRIVVGGGDPTLPDPTQYPG